MQNNVNCLMGAMLGSLLATACSNDSASSPLCYPSDRSGVKCEPYPMLTQDELPDCKEALRSDSISCARRLFAPLVGPPWPFDATLVRNAWTFLHGGCATYVAKEWQLTAEHVLGGTCTWPTEYRYATDGVPFDGDTGCGLFLMMGGHPRVTTCRQDQLWDCWESVPLEGVFDTCIRAADASSQSYLPLASTAPGMGDEVFIVGRPGFNWPSEELVKKYQQPLVSHGTIIDIQGRALIMSAAAFSGDSGGAVLNAAGQLIGVLSSIIGDVREVGIVDLPDSLPDYYSIATTIDELTRAVVNLVLDASDP
jgi:hypothetical protein